MAACFGALLGASPAATRANVVPEPRAVQIRLDRAWDASRARDATASVHAELAKRMRRVDPSSRARLAMAIVDEAARAGMDPLVVLAVIEVESSFHPQARSRAGAVGLMQLRATTMEEEARRSRLGSSDPLDPIANVRAGVRYLRRLVNAFGEIELALMAYNAGPGRIQRYLRAGAIPDRFWTYPLKVRNALARRVRPDEPAGAQLLLASQPAAPRRAELARAAIEHVSAEATRGARGPARTEWALTMFARRSPAPGTADDVAVPARLARALARAAPPGVRGRTPGRRRPAPS